MRRTYFLTLTALMCVWGVSAWALDKKDGVYQIGTGEDLVAFSQLVNGGENAANAVLTADIDMTAESANFLPIGCESLIYSGTFDGRGHRIKNLSISLAQDCVGVFSMIQSPAVIKNFILDESCTIEGGGNYCGIIGQARGAKGPIYMEKLGMEGNITLSGKNGGGIIGNNNGSVANFNMKNCYVTGHVKAGSGSALLIAYAGPNAVITGCWGTGEVEGITAENTYFIRGLESGTITNCFCKYGAQYPTITDEQLTSGELCYLLNGDQSEIAWYQTIGQDAHPVLDDTHGKVYTTAERRCDGQIIGDGTFTNDATQVSAIPVHQYENDVCIVCGQYNPNFLEMKDGFYQISDGVQLVKFSKAVNAGNIRFNAQLTADIDMSAENANYLPIGTAEAVYSGTFDGQGHKISNLNISLTQDCVGLFGIIQSPAVIKNFILDESCSINITGNYAALIGQARGAKGPIYMENLGMEGNVTLTGKNGGGIIGNNMGSVANFNMKNCYMTGNVTAGSNSGLITGYAGPSAVFTSCWGIGEVVGNSGNDVYFIRGMESGSITNCYSKYGSQVASIEDEQLTSGELCYRLNGNQSEIAWYQTIGEDKHPMLDATRAIVYTTAELRCDGSIIGEGTYTNDASQASVIPDHKYENGVCTVCGQKQEGFMEPDAEGFYNISEASQLVWFSMAVSNGGGTFNARLTSDIDMLDESKNFRPIGSESSMYSGTFDGQGHRISNLKISLEQDRVGLFGVIQSPAYIKNLILDESCQIESSANYAGIIGSAMGTSGPVYMENLGMEGNVILDGKNGGGIIGNNQGDVAIFNMKNCYMTGNVTAGTNSGLLTAWAGKNAVIEGCWGTGEVLKGLGSQNEYFVRGLSSGTMTNCFSKHGTQGTAKNFGDEDLISGKLCYLLNGESFINPNWYQTIGEDPHPVWDSTHGTVYMAGEEFGDVHDDASFAVFKDVFLSAEKEYCEEVIAEQALIDQYNESIQTTEASQNMEAFAEAYNEIKGIRTLIESSARAYEALQTKANEVLAYLEEHDDFEGEKRDQLEYYLTENEEPSDLYPNGTILYIMETHTMSEAEVKEETAKIDRLLEEAIASGHTIHSDITTFLINADFSDGFNGWEGEPGHATNSPCAECKNKTCDFYQTLTDLENGIYEVQVNGFFRPGNPNSEAGNLTSTNYGAMFYTNGMQNYLMAAIEDMISVDDAVDGENCYITNTAGSTFMDYAIYDANGDLIGYVPAGQTGFKFAVKGGRYLNRVLVNVTDGQLTVGFKMPGTGVANDCMDIANVKLFYHGTLEDATAEIDASLACMAARAQTLYDYEASYGSDYAEYPNYSAELRSALRAALDAVAITSDVEGKYALMGTFSDLFQQIYENKKEYVKIMNSAESLAELATSLTAVLTEAEVAELYGIVDEIIAAYVAGQVTEEMTTYAYLASRLPFLPEQVDGVYQIGNGTSLTVFSVLVNSGQTDACAVLTADIDMADQSKVFQPIGTVTNLYSGTFDGQFHRISNLVIAPQTERVGLFGNIQTPATIKNLVVDASCSFEAEGNYCGLIAISAGVNGPVYLENLGMEGRVKLSGKNGGGVLGNNLDRISTLNVKNCYMTGTVEASHNSGLLIGYAGNDATFENCWGTGEVLTGVGGQSDYLIRGMDSGGSIINCYSKFGSQVTPVTDEQVASGELCYLLNGDQSEIAFYQTLGEDVHPVFDPTHKKVVKNEDGSYGNITGIEQPTASPSLMSGEVYDLSGRKVSLTPGPSPVGEGRKLPKGIYIINGKKVMVK